MLKIVTYSYKMLRSLTNITILISALVIAPLFIAAQFLPALQGFISDLATDHLPHPTVSATEKKRRTAIETKNRSLNRDNNKLKTRNTDLKTRNGSLATQAGKLKAENKFLGSALENGKAIDRKNSKLALGKVNRVGKTGTRILVRGSSAMLVGAIPFAGVAYDIYAMGADYNDVCDLVKVIDELSGMLYIDSSLYKANYCHKKDEGLALLEQEAEKELDSFDGPDSDSWWGW